MTFVNYDSYIGEFGGRYCEDGVNEATTDSNTRCVLLLLGTWRTSQQTNGVETDNGTYRIPLMFYELNTWDPLGATPWKRSTTGELNGTFAGELDVFAQVTLLMDKNAQFTSQEGNTSATVSSTEVLAGAVSDIEVAGIEVPDLLPDG